MHKIAKGAALAVALLLSGTLANAATQHILGKKLLVKNPTGAETSRLTLILGKEPASGTGCADSIVGNPILNGATLDVFANGGTNQHQTFVLPAGGDWAPVAGGFQFNDPGDSQPVHLLYLKKTGSGICKFKALLKGGDGGSLNVVPPNLGTDGGAVLAINGGDTYCIHLGGADGGTTPVNTNKVYKVLNASTDNVCPAAPITTTTSTSSSTTSSTSSSTSSTSSTTSSTIASCCGRERIGLLSSAGTLRVDNLAPFPFPAGVVTTMDSWDTDTGFPVCHHPVLVPLGGFDVPHFDIPSLNYCSQIITLGCEAGGTVGKGHLWDGIGITVSSSDVNKQSDTSDGVCDTSFTGANCTTVAGGAGANTFGKTVTTHPGGSIGGIRSAIDVPVRSRTWSDSVCSPATNPGCCVTANYGDDTLSNGELLVTLFDFIISPTTDNATGAFVDLNTDGCFRAGSGFNTPGPNGPKTLAGVKAAGPCCTIGQVTNVVSVGAGFSGGAPLFDLGFQSTIPNTIATCGTPAPGSCVLTTNPCLGSPSGAFLDRLE